MSIANRRESNRVWRPAIDIACTRELLKKLLEWQSIRIEGQHGCAGESVVGNSFVRPPLPRLYSSNCARPRRCSFSRHGSAAVNANGIRLVCNLTMLQEIVRHLREALPDEGCGLLATVDEGRTRHAVRFFPGDNIDRSPTRFTMDP